MWIANNFALAKNDRLCRDLWTRRRKFVGANAQLFSNRENYPTHVTQMEFSILPPQKSRALSVLRGEKDFVYFPPALAPLGVPKVQSPD